MGWDLKATVDGAGQAFAGVPALTSDVFSNLGASDSLGKLLFFITVIAGGWLLLNRVPKLWAALEEKLFTNWRLALLAATGLVLSLASGWTTWDGMRNFTNEPLLSFMITFGIQGVMLIIAWLIGESFATGMNQKSANGAEGFSRKAQVFLGPVVGLLLFITLAAWMLPASTSGLGPDATPGMSTFDRFGDNLIVLVAGILAVALVVVYAASDLVKPYLQSSRVVVKNAVLWVMFLACMATSVFFSFDSLFSQIFPQSERERAAELRAQNQVAGIIADIDQNIGQRRLTAAQDLFASEDWQSYDTTLGQLAKAAKESEDDVARYFHERTEERNRAIKEQQERIVSAQSGQAGLAAKKVSLSDELARLKTERPTLAAEYAEKKNALDERAKEIDAKRVEAMAEAKGVEGTGKTGRGPEYRARMTELRKLNDYYKVGEERVNDAKKRLDKAQTRIAQIERELAQVDGDLAKLKGEATTAQQRIELTQSVSETSDGKIMDPSGMLPAFEKARTEFRQAPTAEHLGDIQNVCTQIYGAMVTATPVTKEKVKGLDCDPKAASEAAALVFALNAGASLFAQNCAGGDKLAQNTSTDALFGFAKRCLADSGLPSAETDALRKNINFIELNRDDKAHRFVVTWNAFNDGNRLAYLALGIAIAIDLLVFMSGLFGANAVRSPLSDVPSSSSRSAQQLEAIIENALLPDKYDNARLTLNAMRPITNVGGFMAEVRADGLDTHTRERVLSVLNAGATIHAVEFDELNNRYLIRSELFQFLSIVSKKSFEASEHHVNLAELEKEIFVSLLPDVRQNVDTVLHYMHPKDEKDGFTAEIRLEEIQGNPEELRVVRNVLNAAATMNAVRRFTKDNFDYEVHKDLYRTLARIRGKALFDGTDQPRLEHAEEGSEYRGALKDAGEGVLPGKQPVKTLAAPASEATRQTARREPEALMPLTSDERENLIEDYRHFFLSEFDLTPHKLIPQLRVEPIREAAADAWAALETHGRSNQVLAQLLHQVRNHHRELAESAYLNLKAHFQSDPRRVELIDLVYDEMTRAESVLLLAPEANLVQTLVTQLEEAAQPDGGQLPGEQELKDMLSDVQRALGGLDLNDADSWRQIQDRILETDDGDPQDLPNVVKLHGSNGSGSTP
jgi:hypothetical protein